MPDRNAPQDAPQPPSLAYIGTLAASAAISVLLLVGATSGLTGAQDTASGSEPDSALRAAAERGDVDAQEQLGYMYAFGTGVASDRHAAALWFGEAARGGSDSARYMYCALTRHAATYRLRGAACTADPSGAASQLGRL